jgi:DNA primase
MQVVDQIKDRIDIVEFISGYVPLKKAGRTYKGVCPFHAEKTPSFVVFPHTQTWHCFGACGTGGDIFTFLMRREGLDFSEALRQLADRAGVVLEPPTPRTEAMDARRARFLEMHLAAAQYYHNLLRNADEAAEARDYLSRRGIRTETVERFQLGFARNAWDGLKSYLLGRGYNEAELVEGGLLVARESGDGSYDRFRNRLIIPIRDAKGRVIAFGARALHPNDVPKYLNSPQTQIFDKGATLFGLDLARQAIRTTDRAVLVEGYMDVISAHQAGYANVVAGMGTALTEAQLRELKRLTKHFVLALDADTAGAAATLRGVDTARQALGTASEPVITSRGLVRFEGRLDVDIRIASLPAGRDPDDILRETPDEWPVLIERALPVVSFFMRSLAATEDLSSARGKSQLVRQVLPLVREVGDGVERAHYVNELAQLVRVDERVVLAELERLAPEPRRPAAPEPPEEVETSAAELDARRRFGQEEYLLALVVQQPLALAAVNGELAALGFDGLSADDFQRVENRSLFPLVEEYALRGAPAGESVDHLQQQVVAVDRQLARHLSYLLQRSQVPLAVPGRLAGEEIIARVLAIRVQRVQAEIASLRLLQDESAAAESGDEWRVYREMVKTATHRLHLLERARYQRTLTGRRREEALRQGIALR